MPSPLYLLDTNILLHLIRGKAIGAYIDATYQLRNQTYTPLICVVTHGEIWSLAKENGWGHRKRASLEVMLNNLVTVDINADPVIEAYVDIEYASRRVPSGSIIDGEERPVDRGRDQGDGSHPAHLDHIGLARELDGEAMVISCIGANPRVL